MWEYISRRNWLGHFGHWLVQLLGGDKTTVLRVESKILGGLAMPNYTDVMGC